MKLKTAITGFSGLSPVLSSVAVGISKISSSLASIGLSLPVVGAFIAALAGIGAVAGGISLLHESFDEAVEKSENSTKAYSETKTELENLNSEIETTRQRIEDLQSKPKLTVVEQAELDRLISTNEQLQLQKRLIEEVASEQQRSAANDARDVLTKKKSWKTDTQFVVSGAGASTQQNYGVGDIMDETRYNYQKLTELQQKRDELFKESETLSKDKGLFGLGKSDFEKNEEDIKELDSQIEELSTKVADGKTLILNQLNSLTKDDGTILDGFEDVAEKARNTILNISTEEEIAIKNAKKTQEIIEDDSALKAQSDSILELAKANGELGVSVDEVKDKFPELATALEDAGLNLDDFVNDINAKASEVGNAVEEEIDHIQKIQDAYTSSNNVQSAISSIQEVLSAQQSGKSLSLSDSFNLDSLSEYSDALEYVNGSMQLNAERTREIINAKVEEEIATNNTNKTLAQAKYLENANQIAKYKEQLETASFAEGENKDSIQATIDALVLENNSLIDVCNQYDLLSASLMEAAGSYQHWLNAQNASDYGDMANDTESAIKLIRDTYDANSDIFGNFGSKKFDAAVEFIIPESVDSEDLASIESYMADFSSYLSIKDDGSFDLNIDTFLQKSLDSGLMVIDEASGEYKVAAGKTMQDFADGLNLSSGVTQAFFDALMLKGADFNWADEAVKTMGDLAIEANEAAEQLRNIPEGKDLKLNTNVDEIEDVNGKLSALDETIAEIQGMKSVGLDGSNLENANAVLQYCIRQKQELTKPDIMRLDTTAVTGDIGNALTLLQEFQVAKNDLQVATELGVDTTDAQSKVDSVTAKIQELPDTITKTLNIDTTSSETISSFIEGLSAETMTVTLGVNSDAIDGYNPETKKCEVVYEPNTKKLPQSFSTITRYVTYSPITSSLPTTLSTLTRYVRYEKLSDTDKTVGVNGTAHASGTANANGNWGTRRSGKVLMGELG